MYEAKQKKERMSRRIESPKTEINCDKRKLGNFRYSNIRQRYSYNQDKIVQFIKINGHDFLFYKINNQMSELEIVTQLLENFFNRDDFDYNYSNKTPWGHNGDCSTLCKEFVIICNTVFDIQEMQTESSAGGFLSLFSQKIVHNQYVMGNMDNGKRWYFESHTWIVWRGMPIDVLFGQFGVVSHQTNIKTIYDKHDNFFYQCGDIRFYLKKNYQFFDRYTTNSHLRFSLT